MSTIDIENVNVTAFDTMPTPEEIHSRVDDAGVRFARRSGQFLFRHAVAR